MGIGTWTRKAGMNYARYNPGLSAVNGKLYAIGGHRVSGTSNSYIEEYNPNNNTWVNFYTLNQAFQFFGSAVIDNKIYIVGGAILDSTGNHTFSTSLRVFDPIAKTWITKASIPGTGRSGISCGVINGKLYALGGQGLDSNYNSSLYVYDPATNAWTVKSSIPVAAYALAVVTFNNKFYALDSFSSSKKLYEYDPITDVWDIKSNSVPVYSYSIATVFKDRFYFVGTDSSYINATFEYSPDIDIWRKKAPSLDLTGLYGPSFTALNDILYIAGDGVGGSTAVEATLDIDDYTPTVPVLNYPINGSTINTDTPILQATVSQWVTNTKVEYQLSPIVDFSTGVKSYLEQDSAFRASALASLQVPSTNKLSQQLWYIRTRSVDINGIQSSWSTTYSFTVSHKPSAINLRPTSGNGVLFTAPKLTWQFSDTSITDIQSAYQVIVERNDNGALVTDTGKVTSIDQFYNLALDISLKNITLRWKLQVWDQEDKSAGFTSYNLFQATDAPTVIIITPSNASTVETGSPEVTWSFAASGGRIQANYSVAFYLQGNPNPVYNTGVLPGSNTSNKPSVSVLLTGNNYDVVVTVTDTLGVSDIDTITFLAQYEQPDQVFFTVNDSTYESDGYVLLSWQAVSDASFLLWRVYRRIVGEMNYTVVGEISQVNVTQFKDWQVPSMNTYEYLVVQVVDRFGQQVESDPSAGSVQIELDTGGYWLIDPIDSQNNTHLFLVKEDAYSDKFEQAEITVIGRGRHVDIGEEIGVDGSLTAQLRDSFGQTARSKKRNLEMLHKKKIPVYLRNPFGDLNYISIGDIGITRIPGVGSSEFVDVTIPYLEIF